MLLSIKDRVKGANEFRGAKNKNKAMFMVSQMDSLKVDISLKK